MDDISGPLLVVEIAGLLLLLGLSAFFSASETALTSLSKLQAKAIVEEQGKRARGIAAWVDNPNRMLAAILVGNNIVNIAATVLVTAILLNLFGQTRSGMAGGLTIGVMAFLILVFGEIIPKTLARGKPRHIAVKVAGPLGAVAAVLAPVASVLTVVSGGVIRLFGGSPGEWRPDMTEEELREALDVSEREGVLEEEEREMIHSILEFGDTVTREVMVPRNEMLCLAKETGQDSVVNAILQRGYSRMPVYDRDVDNVVGILYAKDVLKALQQHPDRELNVGEIMRQPYFVPETMPLDELLREFRKRRIHIAIVVDEYGGTAGLVTMEDVIEEIVGEIRDEYDRETEPIRMLENGKAMVEGGTDIGAVNQELGLSLPDEAGVETIAGLVMERLGRVARTGDEVRAGNVTMQVTEATKRRVVKVLVWKKEKGKKHDRAKS